MDGALNFYFICKLLWLDPEAPFFFPFYSDLKLLTLSAKVIVKRNLISDGLTKYKRLTDFNIFIICFSLSMDVLIISMMSLRNTFV